MRELICSWASRPVGEANANLYLLSLHAAISLIDTRPEMVEARLKEEGGFPTYKAEMRVCNRAGEFHGCCGSGRLTLAIPFRVS